ncbi:MAG TPA: hypothetical protein PKD96_02360 [Candidatus Absconditabacterales bacterium]|nr:hypothetical protein [Candidatus Absconditabacterales bacterium]HMT27124.1 hypothetical protein [Candidatus Absconditabacterales bacterium]
MKTFFLIVTITILGLLGFGFYKHDFNIQSYTAYRSAQTLDSIMEKASPSRPVSLIELFYNTDLEKTKIISSGEIIESSSGSLIISTGSTSEEKVLTDQEKIQLRLQQIKNSQ